MDMINDGLNVCKIKVIGVGGAGNNAVNRMIDLNISSAQFVAVNTDKQALMLSKAPFENRIQIGETLTKGLGAGSDPEMGEKAAEESKDAIENVVKGVDLLFIAAGMGGGTGTGAAPVIARIAKECGCVTVAVVTKPFAFEGRRREENAKKGILNLSKYVDTIVIIPNDKLLEALPNDISMIDALKVADDNLRQGICGIADLISTPAMINLDFADVRTIIQNQGLAHMGVGRAKGEHRVVEAVRQAVSSPLLETTIEGARGVILNVTGGKDLTLGQVYEAAHLVQGVVDYSANIIFGANINEALQEEIEITVIATGFVSKGDGAIGDGAPRQNFINLMKEPEQKPEPVKQPEKEVREERIEEIREERPRATYTRVAPANDFRSDEELEDVQPSTDKKSDLPSFMKKLFGKK
ncbi:MAG: cell division protein FtsZ [Clostridia bacterium]|nr:cell division protein FtsZ [Clostridia bacterium]MDY2714391.1 cell division protein FtsZ [Christensenellaceae bacterium]MDY3724112.1 cell division protein FtsZ [Christensenellaceae bacterium]